MTPLCPHTIVISPIGDFTPELLDCISSEIKRVYPFPTEIRPLLADIEFAFHPNRKQYHSTPILEELARRAPEGAIKVLALVQVDLFIPILTHVYGEAQLGGKPSSAGKPALCPRFDSMRVTNPRTPRSLS